MEDLSSQCLRSRMVVRDGREGCLARRRGKAGFTHVSLDTGDVEVEESVE